MATLSDSFLADLGELSDNECNLEGLDNENDSERDLESRNFLDLDSASRLQQTELYACIIQKVEDALKLKENSSYQGIVDCNGLLASIENEIVIIHNIIRDHYRLKFPELEALVSHPIDYAKVVKRIGNEVDLTLVNLESVLPSAIIMVVSVTASTTSGKPLPEDILQKTIEACDRVLALDSAKRKVLDFVESQMGCIAPNLSALVGSAVAAKLMGTAGGLSALANMHPSFVLLCGSKRNNLAGFSSASSQFRVGYLDQTDVFQSTPPALRIRACRLVAAKSILAARVDAVRGDSTGKTGTTFCAEIRKKIEKWQEAPPARRSKPLPLPDLEPKKKRGGRRLRKMKERYAVTNMQRLANRMEFGVVEESSLGDGLGEGYGMVSRAGSLKRRLPDIVAKKYDFRSKEKRSGLTSSLAFSTVQGIELANPQEDQLVVGTQSSYFSEGVGFSNIKSKKS